MLVPKLVDGLNSLLEDRHDLSELLITIGGDLIGFTFLLFGLVFFDRAGSLFDFDLLAFLLDLNLFLACSFGFSLYLGDQNFQIGLQALNRNSSFGQGS